MINIALGQTEIQAGRPDINTRTMFTMIEAAKQQQADIIIFPELSISGYLLGDTWEQEAFLRDCEYWGQKVVEASQDICIMFGNIAVDWKKKNNDGRVRKYNAFFTAHHGKLISAKDAPYPYVIKTLLPNYRAFDDARHFYSLQKLAQELSVNIEYLLQPVEITLNQTCWRIGCFLCEDGWSNDYEISPLNVLTQNHAIDLLVNISSSPFTIGKPQKRFHVFSRQAKENHTPLVYVNHTGIQNNGKTIYTFDGSSAVYDAAGASLITCPAYKETLEIIQINPRAKTFSTRENKDLPHIKTSEKQSPFNNKTTQPTPHLEQENDIASVYRALAYGIEKFLTDIHLHKVVIGISGGIDSAVAAALYAKIVGPENLLLVNMPSIYNSDTTKNLSYALAKNLKCNYTICSIQESVDYTIKQIESSSIKALFNDSETHLTVSSFVSENIQARDRSSRVLAGFAASWGAGFTCNANKSETTVGYSTLYGDQSGFLAALADLWKYQVYDLANYLNKEVYRRAVIPQATIDIVPSAELSSNQAVDEGKGDPIKYPYHDYLFRSFIEHWNKATPEDILTWYKDGSLEKRLGCKQGIINQYFANAKDFIEDLERWWNLYTGMAVAKRIQAPPILALSRRAYGFDHREAQNGPYYTVKYNVLKKELLES